MSERAKVALVAGDGRTVEMPHPPDALVHALGSGKDIVRFVATVDERMDHEDRTAATLRQIQSIADKVAQLVWGDRVFTVSRASFEITETAFDVKLNPIAATIAVELDVKGAPNPRRN